MQSKISRCFGMYQKHKYKKEAAVVLGFYFLVVQILSSYVDVPNKGIK